MGLHIYKKIVNGFGIEKKSILFVQDRIKKMQKKYRVILISYLMHGQLYGSTGAFPTYEPPPKAGK